MAKGDWQALIPGWQIIYMWRKRQEFLRSERERQARAIVSRVESKRALKQLKALEIRRSEAEAAGQMELAKALEKEGDQIALRQITRLLLSANRSA